MQKHKTKDGFALGSWVFNQRTNKDLQQERRKQLDDLGFVWDQFKKLWDESIEALINYKIEFGNCEVPARYKNNNGLALISKMLPFCLHNGDPLTFFKIDEFSKLKCL